MGAMYKERPKQRRARAVWDYITAEQGREPCQLWWNPTAWNMHPEAWWGWWMADYGWNDVLAISPSEVTKQAAIKKG